MVGYVVDYVNLSRCLISYVSSCENYISHYLICFVEFVRSMVLGAVRAGRAMVPHSTAAAALMSTRRSPITGPGRADPPLPGATCLPHPSRPHCRLHGAVRYKLRLVQQPDPLCVGQGI